MNLLIKIESRLLVINPEAFIAVGRPIISESRDRRVSIFIALHSHADIQI
jgi:hypothetical protein